MLIGQTMAESRVFASRRIPADQEELPISLVFTGTEQVSEFDNMTDKRELEILVECIASIGTSEDAENLDDKLDNFANQVEYVFLQDPQLGDLIDNMQLESSEPGVDENDPDIQAVVLKYKVTYYTERTVDQGNLALMTAGVSINGDSQEITLPQ